MVIVSFAIELLLDCWTFWHNWCVLRESTSLWFCS